MVKIFKRVMQALREGFVWFTSKEVLDAINNGAPYEEVKQIVKNKVQGGTR